MKHIVIIPARLASTRFPEKVLAPIAGRPMIAHTIAAARASCADNVIVAGDDPRILDAAREAGAEAMATATTHRSGTDRLAEAAASLGLADEAIVVNLQADEPLMPPTLIDQVANTLADAPDSDVATAATAIHDSAEWQDPNIVKVVCDERSRALYFSRSPIPYARDQVAGWPGRALRHIGIYAYRVGALARLSAAPPSALEQVESLEQLRAFDLELSIRVTYADIIPGPGVDTQADLDKVEHRLEQS